jgi:hypothetical protein
MNQLKGLKVSHTSLARGYVSRKTKGNVEEYEGKFGKGFKVHSPNWESTRYHYVTYYIS